MRNKTIPIALLLIVCMLPCSLAQAFTLTVETSDGGPLWGYRWLVEEDTTFYVDPNNPEPNPTEPPTVRFHTSYMPVRASGDMHDPSSPVPGDIALDPSKRYFVTVLPYGAYTVGGGQLVGNGALTVTVNPRKKVSTAQMSVFAFEDNNPINNNPDIANGERGLEGFTVVIEEPAGRYGMVGGQLSLDAYGNPLGTSYNPDGSVDTMGDGIILTGPDGYVIVKNLPPAKYGVRLTPPAGESWMQTTTIEGSKVIDAWIKSNEPLTLVEFGITSTHVFMGFVQPDDGSAYLTGGYTISGEVVNFHLSRPPDLSLTSPTHSLGDISQLRIGLNSPDGVGVYAQPVDGPFSIPNVPDGLYQLVIWDEFLQVIIAFQTVTVDGADVDLGPIAVNEWFSHQWHHVFFDPNANGFPDDLSEDMLPVGAEPGMLEQAINIRFRDGTLYQSYPTDLGGYIPFDGVFPFFNWLIAEVDFTRFEATGVTIVVDDGGEVTPSGGGDDWTLGGRTNPQSQPDNGGAPYRTETGPVLTQAFQGFAGMTSGYYWGKRPYGTADIDVAPYGDFPGGGDIDWNSDGEFEAGNGGIAGIVYYEITRAEDNPQYAAFEEWEPGIPRIQVNLYADSNGDQVIDDIDGNPGPTLADVDNYPFGWFNGSAARGAEDVDQNANGAFDAGDAVQIGWSDSWDDNLPTDCPGDTADLFYNDGQCYDGIRNFNQTRPGVFDGGYAFNTVFPDGWNALGTGEVAGVVPGDYIVQVTRGPHQIYQHRVEESKNVDFGEDFSVPLLLPAPCVGEPHTIAPYLSLFPRKKIESPYAWVDGVYIAPERPMCDLKLITVTAGFNAPVDFSLYTNAPIAAHFTGLVTNDLANEFDPSGINFIEKTSAPFIPIAIRDYLGVEVMRTYTDQWGIYNGLLPSTITANIGSPSGIGPAMYTICINDGGPVEVSPGVFDIDPFFKLEYTQSCYTFQFMPGTTTYLDTPVLPISAFAGRESFPLDCSLSSGTPLVVSVEGVQGGPYVPSGSNTLTITGGSATTQVRNPAYNPFDPGSTEPPTVPRDYSFGPASGPRWVKLGGTKLDITSWTEQTIEATVPGSVAPGQYQLFVRRGGAGPESVSGVTVTVGTPAGVVRHVNPPTAPYGSPGSTPIQDAIDVSSSGDLILVHPGNYSELVILYKDVQLQGSGAPSTILNAIKAPVEKLADWQQRVEALVAGDPSFLLPNQEAEFSLFPNVGIFPTERGPGILVLAPSSGDEPIWNEDNHARIDGLTVMTADNGGGIMVNGYARNLRITNNRLLSNSGLFSGGIRLGHPVTPFAFNGEAVDAKNDNVYMRWNIINQNGAIAEGGNAYGGGVSIYNGSDGYELLNNCICGNFSIGGGGGVGHKGLSDDGRINRNQVLFNQQFHQTINDSAGGGIAIEGLPGVNGSLTAGSGSVRINRNLIQGNFSATGDGGGLRLSLIDGQGLTPGDPSSGFDIDITNNVIVNNVSGLAGAGVSLQDAADVHIINNTIAHNDSTATAGAAWHLGLDTSEAQPAGVLSRAHTPDVALLTGQTFSEPELVNNIIWKNRSFYFALDTPEGIPGLLPNIELGDDPVFWDLGVLGTGGQLDPRYCIITEDAPYPGPVTTDDPLFLDSYFNGGPAQIIVGERQTQAQAAAALDEGGNFIDVWYGPLSLTGDYHISDGTGADPISPAVDTGTNTVLGSVELSYDMDGDTRPYDSPAVEIVDIGADETQVIGSIADYAPLAVSDFYEVTTSGVIDVAAPGVMSNDSDPNGDPLTARMITNVPQDAVDLRPDGSFFVNPGIFVGTASFTYVVNDGGLDSNVATCTITREMVAQAVTVDATQTQWNVQAWRVRGLSSAPAGTEINVYFDGTHLGTTQVRDSGFWVYRILDGPDPGAATTVDIFSDTGAKLLNVPLFVTQFP